MKRLVSGSVLVGLALLTGCADYPGNWYRASYYSPSNDAYSRSDIDELLGFGAAFANKSRARRAEECRRLLKFYQKNPDVGVRLHLLIARTLSEACGHTTKILAAVGGIAPEQMPDGRVQNLVAIHMEMLRHAGGQPRRAAVAERKPDRKPTEGRVSEPKPGGKENSVTDEAQILREKLEAIRAIEKSMDAPAADTRTGDGGRK
ncbi:hypothetical protein [Methylocaldum szegediense]|uniref:hypothetical protein n=1 Tax=Methylocaldum szegediense TaxID=73780 RepID=UPI000405EF96|nr:hypothetical protein [Methylocaldum szegediense]